MGEVTGISWTEKTWNPWMGCHKVSPGCAKCYAEAEHARFNRPDFGVVRRSKTTFDNPKKWSMASFVFTCSLSDFFHPHADAWREEAWDIIRQHHRHTYQILTKRTVAIPERLPADWGDGWPQVWLGASAENDRFRWRLDQLAEIPSSIRFISAEPLLDELDLDPVFAKHPGKFQWLIAGGESGPGHRPMEVAWARRLRDTCRAHGVHFWMKQQADLYPGQRNLLPVDLHLQDRPVREGQRPRPANFAPEGDA